MGYFLITFFVYFITSTNSVDVACVIFDNKTVAAEAAVGVKEEQRGNNPPTLKPAHS